MSDSFLDLGPIDRLGNLPNEDIKAGFVEAVFNAQPRLAMSYLIHIINDLGNEVESLKQQINTQEPTKTVSRSAKTAKTVESANESEA